MAGGQGLTQKDAKSLRFTLCLLLTGACCVFAILFYAIVFIVSKVVASEGFNVPYGEVAVVVSFLGLSIVTLAAPDLLTSIVRALFDCARYRFCPPERRRPVHDFQLAVNDGEVARVAEMTRNREHTPRGAQGVRDFVMQATNMTDTIWQLFFNQVFEVGEKLKGDGRLSDDDIKAVEPWLVIGLPGVVIANVAIRSAASGDPGEVTLVNGQIVRESDRPRYMPGADLWDELIVVNRHLYRLQLNDEETEFFKLACFKAGQIGPDARRPASVASDTARGRDLMLAVSEAIGLAIEVSRLPRFTDYLQQCLDLLAASKVARSHRMTAIAQEEEEEDMFR